jgi:pimeloyl-ACP methyl ester carboxylesterase
MAAWPGHSARGAAPHEIILADCLVLPQVGRYGRSAVHLDPVEALIVAGRWKAPRAGETVARANGDPQTWTAAKAKAGVLEQAGSPGGYVFWTVKAESPRVLLLEARGHQIVYVNGEPRAGDPYQNGIVRLPVFLRSGVNEFLFQFGRGQLQAKLVEPSGPAELDARDATLPDYRIGLGESLPAALLIDNASEKPLAHLTLRARIANGVGVTTPVDTLPPLSVRKAGFRLPICERPTGDSTAVTVDLFQDGHDTPLATTTIKVRVRQPDQSYKRTFISEIDGSVQYFAVQPARINDKAKAPALVLTLHGAGVEAIGQADAYKPKSWCHIVAPTNRRPYGFDWEDWGRVDALEVLALAKEHLQTDPQRTYLTGHSMGGHGAWQVGVTCPDLFAAVAPSAGWISFATYTGAIRTDDPTPMQAMMQRAASPGDTLILMKNLRRDGVYVLHGEADDNVPVTEARAMRKNLGTFHADFAYYERPGAGHWWGSECVDWPPLFEFLERHSQPRLDEVRRVDFVTASPRVSSRCDWLEITAQAHALRPSHANIALDPEHRKFAGTTENVTRLSLDGEALAAGKPVRVELDGQTLVDLPWPTAGGRLWLGRVGDKWSAVAAPAPELKGSHRYGPFKDAFRNHVLFVYGTKGSAAENAWSYAKARFDAESFWYRGNGSIELRADTDFDASKDRDRNVILYGNADNNSAWPALLGSSPVQVRSGVVRIGEREEKGGDLACLFVRPRAGSDRAMVGAVSGTGLPGLRLTERVPYFLSGAGFPDCIVLGSDTLERGTEGIRVAGFFGMDWKVESGDWTWRLAPK